MTTEEEKLVLDNISLAYDIAWKYNKKFSGKIELEELKSLALFGLTKAAKTFDQNLGFTFSTYAFTIIRNEILMFHRNNIIKSTSISLSDKVTDNIEIQDTIASEIDIFDELLNNICIDKLYAEINTLKPRYKAVIEFKLKGYTMIQIGDKLNISQSQVSRDYQKALNILRNKFKDWR